MKRKKKKKKRASTWADLFCRFFEIALPLSPDQWARTHRHSERTCTREWSSDGRTSSSFSVKVNVLPTKAITKKLFWGFLLGDTSLKPPWWVPQLLQCSNKSDRLGNRDATVIQFEERCTAKKNFETSKFTSSISLHNTVVLRRAICLFLCNRRGQYLSKRTCYAFSWIFFFLARGWNQCVRWTRNTNKKRRALMILECSVPLWSGCKVNIRTVNEIGREHHPHTTCGKEYPRRLC